MQDLQLDRNNFPVRQRDEVGRGGGQVTPDTSLEYHIASYGGTQGPGRRLSVLVK